MAKEKRGKKKIQKKEHRVRHPILFLIIIAFVGSASLFFFIPGWMSYEHYIETDREVVEVKTNDKEKVEGEIEPEEVIEEKKVVYEDIPNYIPIPKPLKSIYMSQCVVGTPSFRNDLVELIEETELNSVIIDIKDYTGKIAFDTDHPDLVKSVSNECGARDMKSFIDTLHSKGIYVIGRITVFQDPYYSLAYPELAVKFETPEGAVWKDGKGLSFIDVGAEPFWEYIVTLSLESYKFGFDELNYDYIRFPSDGPMSNIRFDWAGNKEKQVALEEFFVYLHKEMKNPDNYPKGVNPPVISADLFGMVTTNHDDLNIGQVLERALPYFDYIAPMVYPSHYPDGFNGWSDPNTVPYELIKFVMDSAVRRTVATESYAQSFDSKPIYKDVIVPPTSSTTATTTKKVATGKYTKRSYDKNKIRPWLQDFDYPVEYTAQDVRAQIEATYDAGLDSWMLWAPSNRYTRSALESVEVSETASSENVESGLNT